MIGDILCNKYTVDSILGNGKFGVVYKGSHVTKGDIVAIKTEPMTNRFKVLRHEVTILNYLFYNGVRNIPTVYWFGQHTGYTCLAMSHYTCDLNDYIKKKGAMDNNKLGSMMIKCLSILENIHKYHILHRDIKPHNFMIKDGDIYLIDFGLSTVFIDENGDHIIKQDLDHIIGTPKYVSYYNHCGENISRRDDLISLGYMYLYLQKGCLPWDAIQSCPSNLPQTSTAFPRNILFTNAKQWSDISVCSDGSIAMYLKYCYELKYNDEPNYHILMELFVN